MAEVDKIQFSREVPVRHDVDVCIAGGGPAGVSAALAAAEHDCRVFVVEGHSCFGGMGTAGLVPAFMQFSDGVNFLAEGIGRRVYETYKSHGAVFHDEPTGSVSVDAEILKRVYDDLVTQGDIDFTFHTQLIAVEKSGREVSFAICVGKSGIFAIKAKVFVDCTGDGDLAAGAGAEYEQGDESGSMMPGTLCSLWADIDTEISATEQNRPYNKHVDKAFEDGVFTTLDRHVPGIWPIREHVGGGNIGHCFGVDATDERSITNALLQGRKTVLEYERYFKEYLKGYENMKLVSTGSLLGVRETRRIVGDYMLCLDDFLKRAVFPDEVGRYCYPVDIHAARPDEKSYKEYESQFCRDLKYEEGESYGIPYRVLTPRGLDNVLVAGRCVGTDRAVNGSIRVIPGCFITGQAAGVAAAISAECGTSVHQIDIKELQDRLKRLGAYLPNAS